jgi:diacylglycerol kinase family enzyme
VLNGQIQSIHLGKITLKGRDALSVTRNELKDTANLESQRTNHEIKERTDHVLPVTRYFLLMAGIGFDGEVVFKINERIKKTAGRGAYVLSGLRTFITYRPGPLTITSKDISLLGYAAIISNAACYGGTFKVAPDARLTDPSFYVFVTHKRGRLSLLRYVSGIVGGFHLSFKDITYFRADELMIEGSAPIQLDGDYIGNAPATITIEQNALQLVTTNRQGTCNLLTRVP